MIGLGHLKTQFGRYAALWLAGFLLTGAAVLAGLFFVDLFEAVDRVLPWALALVGLGLGAGVVMSLLSKEGPGTKILVVLLALILLLPLLWAPVSAAVVIAFFADRAIEYSDVYAAFQIGVARLLYPVGDWLGGGADVLAWAWNAFQVVGTVVGFISAWVRAWPVIRRMLSPEAETVEG